MIFLEKIATEINEFWEAMTGDNKDIFIVITWLIITTVSWRVLLTLGPYLVFATIHLGLIPLALAYGTYLTWKKTGQQGGKWDFSIALGFLGFVLSIIFLSCPPLVESESSWLNLFLGKVKDGHYYLNSIDFFWKILNPFGLAEINPEAHIFSTQIPFAMIATLGNVLISSIAAAWLIDKKIADDIKKEEEERERLEQEMWEQGQAIKQKEVQLKWEQEQEELRLKAIKEKEIRQQRKKEAREKTAWDSGFLD